MIYLTFGDRLLPILTRSYTRTMLLGTPVRHIVYRINMRPQEDTRIDPDNCKAIDYETKRNTKCEEHLFLLYVRQNEILADEGRCNRKACHRQAGYQEYRGHSRMHEGVAMKPVEADTLFHNPQETQA